MPVKAVAPESPEAEIREFEIGDSEALMELVEEAAAEGDDAALRAAKAFELVDRSRAYRDAGFSLLGDLVGRLGVALRRARELLDLGRVLRGYPGIESLIRKETVPIEKAIAIAPAMLARRWSLSQWVNMIRAYDLAQLRRESRRENKSRIVDGVRMSKEYLDLSREARAMLFDAHAGIARLRANDARSANEPGVGISRSEVLAKAIRVALGAVRDEAPVGERRYLIAEHPANSFEITAVEARGELVPIRFERARFRLEQTPPEDVQGTVARLRKRHRVSSEDVLDVADRAIAQGVSETEGRPLAWALVEEMKNALEREKGSWGRIARGCHALDRLGVPDWREWVASAIRRSLATVSELLACGRAAACWPRIAQALEEGRLGWTHVRTLAGYLDGENFDELFEAMLHESVRELEKMRELLRKLADEKPRERGEARAKGTGLPPVEIELPASVWQDLEALMRLLSKKAGRGVSVAEALEEALWQALARWGPPAPLRGVYRILVHFDRGTGFSWMSGPGGEIVPVSGDELARIRATGAGVYDVEAEEKAAARREVERLVRACSGWEPARPVFPQDREPTEEEEDELERWLHRAQASGRGGVRGEHPPGARMALGEAEGAKPPRGGAEARDGRSDDWYGARAVPGRAPQPEASLRLLIYLRDGCRCSVCGCHASLYVHVHHVDPRSEGGGNDPRNLVLICVTCHAVTHSHYGRLVPREPAGVRIIRIRRSGGAEGEAESARERTKEGLAAGRRAGLRALVCG
ncbi:MAG: HNH endonuclease [Planctomycetes bacterium]|nr:HNH endonuclease [Planctomycetota bacterium]